MRLLLSDASTKRPVTYEVANEKGLLVFIAKGANTSMPWLLNLEGLGVSGDERYLVVWYKAAGMSTSPGVYFLHGEEGSYGGRTYAMADQLSADGRWHTVAVDLLAIDPLEPTRGLAVKVRVHEGGRARLAVEKIWFADTVPKGAKVAQLPRRRSDQTATLDFPVLRGASPISAATYVTAMCVIRSGATPSSR